MFLTFITIYMFFLNSKIFEPRFESPCPLEPITEGGGRGLGG